MWGVRAYNKKRVSFSFFRRLPRFMVVLLLSSIVAGLIIFTTYAPDAYVFVQYAWKDNILRDVGLHSLVSNTVLFDIGTIVFDTLNISGTANYLIAVTVVYLLVFYLKYLHFLADLSISRILLVFTASLVTYDINQLRFQLALLLVLYTIIAPISRKLKFLLHGLSFFTHILPVTVMYTARLYYLPLLLLPAVLVFLAAIESRVIVYFIPTEFIPFKVFALIIPNLICFWHYKKKHQSNQIAKLAFSYTLIFIFFLGFNGMLAARFLEASFFLFVVWWGLCRCRSKVLTGTLWFFSLSMLVSRLANGVSAGDPSFFFDI